MGKTKKGIEDGVSRFDGFGVDFKCKLIGIANVSAPRGDEMCQKVLAKLTAQALKDNKEKKAHKQKITVNITFKGIRLLDEVSEKIEYAHPIHRISFISHDDSDKRTFGYVVGTKEGYKLFAVKAMKEAEQITKTLKDLFQEVFERHQAEKNKTISEPSEIKGTEEQQTNGGSSEEVAEDTVKESADPFLVDWGQLNDQIQVMQDDGMKHSDTAELFSGASFDSNNVDFFARDPFSPQTHSQPKDSNFNPFADNATPQTQANSFDAFGIPSQQQRQQPPSTTSTDLFALNPPSAQTTSKESTATDGPLLMNDPFAELKKNINELHKQNHLQQQQQYAYQQQGFHNSFPVQPNPYMVPQGNNPFFTPGYGSNQVTQPPMQQPIIPPRPQPTIAPNPFLTQQQTSQDMGWSVSKPSAATKVQPKAVVISGGPDPFAFLDNQTGPKIQAQPAFSADSNPSNDIFDLLG